MTQKKLNLGCGKDIREGYLNLDINPVAENVLKQDVENLKDFDDCSVSELLAYDILEHFPLEKINQIVQEWCRVIEPGGKIVIQTPDIEVIFNEYYKKAQAGEITWARLSRIIHGIDEPFQVHYVTLSFPWLKEILEQFGMTDVTKKQLAQNMLVEARKKMSSESDQDEKETASISEASVLNSAYLKLRLRAMRSIRRFYRRHGISRTLKIDRISELFIKYFLHAKASGPTVVPTNYGFEIIVDPTIDSGLERAIYEKGVYEAGTLHVIQNSLRNGDIFLDIGSNIGLMSLLASTAVGPTGKVYAFEPEPDTFAILSRNIKINAFENIYPQNFALGAGKNKKNIFREPGNRGSASLLGPMGNTIGGKEVSVDTLDTFVNEKIAGPVRMIKIDVEGWELEVLKGAESFLGSDDAPIICIEYSNIHPTHGGCQVDIYNKICGLNKYRVFKLQHGKEVAGKLVEIKGAHELPQHDNLFCFLEKHISEMNSDIFINNN